MLRILHLSDIHLGTPSKGSHYQVGLITDLEQELKVNELDYLVISGDIATRSMRAEYQVAFDFVRGLLGHYKLSRRKVIIVPGNHDLNWDLSARAYIYTHKIPSESSKEFISLGELGALRCNAHRYRKRFANFNNFFYKRVYRKDYPPDYDEQAILYPAPDDHVLFLGLNSCWELDHHYYNRASINVESVNRALEQLIKTQKYGYARKQGDEIDPQGNKYTGWLKIVVCHHPITGREMMNDEIMQLLAVHGFQLFLHGHIHEATESFYKYDDKRHIHIVGAGTFGAPATQQEPGIPLQYNLLTYDPEAHVITVETRKKEKPNGIWKADARWGDSNNPAPRYTIKLE